MKFRVLIIKPSVLSTGFDIAVDGSSDLGLCVDEALGVIASVLFGGEERPRYVQTIEDAERLERRWESPPEWMDEAMAAEHKRRFEERFNRNMAAHRDLVAAAGIIGMLALPRKEVAHV